MAVDREIIEQAWRSASPETLDDLDASVPFLDKSGNHQFPETNPSSRDHHSVVGDLDIHRTPSNGMKNIQNLPKNPLLDY